MRGFPFNFRKELSVNRRGVCAVLVICLCCLLSVPARAAEDTDKLIQLYEEYEANFAAIEHVDDIVEYGYTIVEDQSFDDVVLESFGEEEVTFLPIMDNTYHRLAVLITDSNGKVLFKTNQLETNYKWLGQLEQPTKGISSVSFQDLNRDGLTDIVLITNCQNNTGDYAGKPYKVGDVLFQRDGSFYRDWRISDKINRFSMNRSVGYIVSYVRDGISTEALYTAATLDQLVENGFNIFQEQYRYRHFEKWGSLWVVPGIVEMGRYNVFMIYLVNDQGDIVWSFQPMKDYDNLYALKGAACQDLDGDGMKDLLFLCRFSYVGPDGDMHIDTVCNIYYQRTDGFAEDTEFADTYQCKDVDTVSGLVTLIREYWGWTTEE